VKVLQLCSDGHFSVRIPASPARVFVVVPAHLAI
jgi:hypothetical protein